MLEDKNTYITETGALMSAYDYSFLSADQKERCKVYKMEPTKEDKPDFEKILDQYIYANIGLTLDSPDTAPMDKGECKYMMRQMYRDYVIPMRTGIKERDAKIAELEYKVGDLIGCTMETRGEVLQLKSENEGLKSELDKAKELLSSTQEEFTAHPGLDGKIRDFIKETRVFGLISKV